MFTAVTAAAIPGMRSMEPTGLSSLTTFTMPGKTGTSRYSTLGALLAPDGGTVEELKLAKMLEKAEYLKPDSRRKGIGFTPDRKLSFLLEKQKNPAIVIVEEGLPGKILIILESDTRLVKLITNGLVIEGLCPSAIVNKRKALDPEKVEELLFEAAIKIISIPQAEKIIGLVQFVKDWKNTQEDKQRMGLLEKLNREANLELIYLTKVRLVRELNTVAAFTQSVNSNQLDGGEENVGADVTTKVKESSNGQQVASTLNPTWKAALALVFTLAVVIGVTVGITQAATLLAAFSFLGSIYFAGIMTVTAIGLGMGSRMTKKDAQLKQTLATLALITGFVAWLSFLGIVIYMPPIAAYLANSWMNLVANTAIGFSSIGIITAIYAFSRGNFVSVFHYRKLSDDKLRTKIQELTRKIGENLDQFQQELNSLNREGLEEAYLKTKILSLLDKNDPYYSKVGELLDEITLEALGEWYVQLLNIAQNGLYQEKEAKSSESLLDKARNSGLELAQELAEGWDRSLSFVDAIAKACGPAYLIVRIPATILILPAVFLLTITVEFFGRYALRNVEFLDKVENGEISIKNVKLVCDQISQSEYTGQDKWFEVKLEHPIAAGNLEFVYGRLWLLALTSVISFVFISGLGITGLAASAGFITILNYLISARQQLGQQYHLDLDLNKADLLVDAEGRAVPLPSLNANVVLEIIEQTKQKLASEDLSVEDKEKFTKSLKALEAGLAAAYKAGMLYSPNNRYVWNYLENELGKSENYKKFLHWRISRNYFKFLFSRWGIPLYLVNPVLPLGLLVKHFRTEDKKLEKFAESMNRLRIGFWSGEVGLSLIGMEIDFVRNVAESIGGPLEVLIGPWEGSSTKSGVFQFPILKIGNYLVSPIAPFLPNYPEQHTLFDFKNGKITVIDEHKGLLGNTEQYVISQLNLTTRATEIVVKIDMTNTSINKTAANNTVLLGNQTGLIDTQLFKGEYSLLKSNNTTPEANISGEYVIRENANSRTVITLDNNSFTLAKQEFSVVPTPENAVNATGADNATENNATVNVIPAVINNSTFNSTPGLLETPLRFNAAELQLPVTLTANIAPIQAVNLTMQSRAPPVTATNVSTSATVAIAANDSTPAVVPSATVASSVLTGKVKVVDSKTNFTAYVDAKDLNPNKNPLGTIFGEDREVIYNNNIKFVKNSDLSFYLPSTITQPLIQNGVLKNSSGFNDVKIVDEKGNISYADSAAFKSLDNYWGLLKPEYKEFVPVPTAINVTKAEQLISSLKGESGLYISHPQEGNTSFTYDNSLVVQNYIANGDKANSSALLDKFSNNTTLEKAEDGLFWPSYDANTGVALDTGAKKSKVGPNLWIAIEMANFDEKFNETRYLADIERIAGVMAAKRNPNFGIGGIENSSSVSTEEMLDSFTVYDYLARKTGKTIWINERDKSWTWLYAFAYDEDQQRLIRGEADQTVATDTSSWGASIPTLPSEINKTALIAFAENSSKVEVGFIREDGQTVNVTDFAFKDNQKYVFPEISAQMALAYWENNQTAKYNETLNELAKMQNSIGGIPYASELGVSTGHGWNVPLSNTSISSTVYPLLALKKSNPLNITVANNLAGSEAGFVSPEAWVDARYSQAIPAFLNSTTLNKITLDVQGDVKSTTGTIPVFVNLSGLDAQEKSQIQNATFAVLATDVDNSSVRSFSFNSAPAGFATKDVNVMVATLENGTYKLELYVFNQDLIQKKDTTPVNASALDQNLKISKLDKPVFKVVSINRHQESDRILCQKDGFDNR
ncbi:MAG: hypothetical protein NT030_07440 [Candidatus Saganbacteria bacterium]|nr:hypothetical protein [Candidatus Saganbacteria bacterium]